MSSTDQPGFQWVELIEIANIPPAYINPNETLHLRDLPVKVTPETLRTALTVWIAGEIDYRDSFGHGHQSGYGRRYVALADNNLVFDESTTGMNYDRPMAKEKQREYESKAVTY